MKKLTILNIRKLILILVLIGLQTNLIAQKKADFITVTNNQTFALNANQIDRIEKLKKNPTYKKIQPVIVGVLTDYITKGDLAFNIPDRKGKYKAHVKEFRYISEKDYVWKGDLIDQYGSVTIICENGNVFGYIAVNNQYYEIQNVDSKNIFIEFDREYLSKCKSAEVYEPSTSKKINEISAKSSMLAGSCTGQIRILVLYTAAAQASVGNIQNTATLAVSQFNEALRSSGISSGQLTAILTATIYIDFMESSGAISYDRNRISQNILVLC